MADSSLLPGAAPDFSDPLGLLRACHERILGHCCTLVRLIEHLQRHGADQEARTAMARIHRYFSTAGQHHHCDEDEDLFPALRGREPALDALMADLSTQHNEMEQLWSRLAAALSAPEEAAGDTELEALVDRFVRLYRQHVLTENTRLLPRAQALLTAEEKQALGQKMAARRGLRD